MGASSRVAKDEGDEYGLHYVLPHRRCVVYYDTLEAALEAAFKNLGKAQCLDIWISDTARQVLLDQGQIKARLESEVVT